MNPASMVAKSFLRDIGSWIFSIRRRTWLIMALVMTVFLSLAVWAALSLFGWFFGMAREGVSAAPEALRSVTEQVTKSIPGANQALEKLSTVVQPAPPPRDVSGTDPAMVERYPGLARTSWQREGQEVTVQYEGTADYHAVVDHYVKGFASQGYLQNLVSATPDEERHEYRKAEERISLLIARKERSSVKVVLAARLP